MSLLKVNIILLLKEYNFKLFQLTTRRYGKCRDDASVSSYKFHFIYIDHVLPQNESNYRPTVFYAKDWPEELANWIWVKISEILDV